MVRAMTETRSRVARVLIVDDHPSVREGLTMRIAGQPDMEVCGEASDTAEALALVNEKRPDVAIIDISLKTGNGLDLVKRIKSRDENVRMLVCSMYNESLYAERALRAGALGYINKENATEEIILALRRVLDGKIYLSEHMAELLLNRTIGKRALDVARTPIDMLSDRELEVFQLIGEGLDTHRIAEKISVSPKTVETYRTRIKEKLHLTSSLELVQKAMQWAFERKDHVGSGS